MTDLFDHLSAQFEAGHARDIPDLLTDAQFVDGQQTAAAVLIAITDRPVLKQRSGRTDKNAPVLTQQSDRTEMNGPGVLLTQRPRGMRSHPGQVAFPGGKLDPGEDIITAALREAEEELALPREAVRVIGTSDLYQTGTGFDVTPVLAVVPPDLMLTPNPQEVEAWFEAPLSLLLDPDNWQTNEVFWRGAMRRYLEMDYDGFRIWGVTAAILSNLSRRIDLKQLNAHVNGRIQQG